MLLASGVLFESDRRGQRLAAKATVSRAYRRGRELRRGGRVRSASNSGSTSERVDPLPFQGFADGLGPPRRSETSSFLLPDVCDQRHEALSDEDRG